MYFVLPFATVVIIIVILILCAAMAVASIIETIKYIAITIVVAISLFSIIYTILEKDTPLGEKKRVILMSVISGIINFFSTNAFFSIMSSIDTGGLFEMVEFIFVLVLCGVMWLGSVFAAIMAMINSADEPVATVCSLIVSVVLGSILISL